VTLPGNAQMENPVVPRSTDVLVIGGGLLGCATAYHLAKEGVETVLLERGEINREASGTNAGSLHFQIPLFQMKQYEGASSRQLDPLRASVAIHREAAQLWRSLPTTLNAELGIRLEGGLVVAETTQELDRLKEKARIEALAGLETEIVSTTEMLSISPSLSPHLLGADYSAEEGYANPLSVGPAYAKAAIAAGARIQLNAEVTGIEFHARDRFVVTTNKGVIEAARVVNAAGAWAGDVARMLGMDLPITPRCIQVHVTDPRPPTLAHLIQHAGRRLTLKQTQWGTFLIGGGWPAHLIASTGAKRTSLNSLVGNAWVAAEVVPALKGATILRSWAGLAATTADTLPVFGEYRRTPGFWIMQFGPGFTLGPVAGLLMSEVLTGRKPSIPIGTYDPERYLNLPSKS